jgi:hypothetical protein
MDALELVLAAVVARCDDLERRRLSAFGAERDRLQEDIVACERLLQRLSAPIEEAQRLATVAARRRKMH